MVYRAVSTWSAPAPEDEAAFEKYYTEVHVPFAARVPGTLALVLTRTSDGFETNPPAFYRVAEMHYEDKDAFLLATQSREWAEMREDGIWVHERFGCVLQTGLGEKVVSPLDPSGPIPGTAMRGEL